MDWSWIMPNWCTNVLSICGPPSEVDGFVNACKSEEENGEATWAILDRLYPIPEDLKHVTSRFSTVTDDDPDRDQKLKNIENYGVPDWYDWCNTNWGTKWADCHTELVYEHDCHPSLSTDDEDKLKKVMFRFDSAWAPPEKGFDAIAMMFPKLVFDLRFEEPGMCFQGFKIWANGECQQSADMEYMMSGEVAYDNIDWNYDNYTKESVE